VFGVCKLAIFWLRHCRLPLGMGAGWKLQVTRGIRHKNEMLNNGLNRITQKYKNEL
jgi:hypothetical protein